MCEHCARREACQQRSCKPSKAKALVGLLFLPFFPVVLLIDIGKSLRARKKHYILWNTEPAYRQMVLFQQKLQEAIQQAMKAQAKKMAEQAMETAESEQA